MLQEVDVAPIATERLVELIGAARAEEFDAVASEARSALAGRCVVNVNSAANGGGVAELLRTLLAYARGVGVDTRWLVIDGDTEFFTITKRIHNHLYGTAGDNGPLDRRARERYEATLAPNAEALLARLRPGDIVLLHDPQTAGLLPALRRAGHPVVWRCHVGRDHPNEYSVQGWAFLRDYLEAADAFVFTRAAFAPPWVPRDRLHVITPSIDPFSPKNELLDRASVRAILAGCGITAAEAGTTDEYRHQQGRRERMTTRADLVGTDPVPPGAPLVVQLSRWDPQKDMVGVLRAFVEHLDVPDAHLLLTGPSVTAVDDDPEAAGELARCQDAWSRLPPRLRQRVHLACIPLDDPDQAATVANAVQRHARVVVQKSLAEGFGLTVVEAMWKHRPVVASGVGGIVDQIDDGIHGLLVDDPTDIQGVATRVALLLEEAPYAATIGAAGYQRAHLEYIGDRHLEKYGRLLATLLD